MIPSHVCHGDYNLRDTGSFSRWLKQNRKRHLLSCDDSWFTRVWYDRVSEPSLPIPIQIFPHHLFIIFNIHIKSWQKIRKEKCQKSLELAINFAWNEFFKGLTSPSVHELCLSPIKKIINIQLTYLHRPDFEIYTNSRDEGRIELVFHKSVYYTRFTNAAIANKK